MFRFVYPWVLAGLLLPLLLWFLERFRSREIFIRFPLESRVKKIFSFWDQKLIHLNPILIYLALACLIVGLARPQWGRHETEVTSEGIDIILALDASGSMAAMDFNLNGKPVNRLSVVKKVVTEFIRKQTGDRIGMIIFGDHAYTQSPLTLDYDVLIQLLDHIQIGIAGEGTAVGDGLALSVKRLKDVPGKSKVVILLTDGRTNAGKISPQKAAEIAKALGVKVYTIGIGTQGMVPFPQKGMFGTRLIYVQLDMDQEALEEIAAITGGKYFYAADTRKLEAIYNEIGRLEKTKVEVRHYETFDELYIYCVLAGLGLLALEVLLSATVLRRLA
jgi:Ca-activated chloride channel family protein